MSRTRTPYESTRTVLDFPSPIEYVKNVLDSKSPEYKGGYETDGHVLLSSRYSNLKDEKQKKLIAEAVVQLLDDSDYACDAIPVASELGLSEAKEWFLNLSKKSIEEIRNIKTNGYTNAYFCLVNYAKKNEEEFTSIIKNKVHKEKLLKGEYSFSLDMIASFDPLWVENDLVNHIEKSLDENQQEVDMTYTAGLIVGRYLEKKGWDNIVTIAEKFKTSAPYIKKSLINIINKFIIPKPEFKSYGLKALEILS